VLLSAGDESQGGRGGVRAQHGIHVAASVADVLGSVGLVDGVMVGVVRVDEANVLSMPPA
jgi:hypothetical protein